MPDNNYIIFEKWIFPIFKQMLLEQETQVQALHSEHLCPSQTSSKTRLGPNKLLDEVKITCYIQSKDTNDVLCVRAYCDVSSPRALTGPLPR